MARVVPALLLAASVLYSLFIPVANEPIPVPVKRDPASNDGEPQPSYVPLDEWETKVIYSGATIPAYTYTVGDISYIFTNSIGVQHPINLKYTTISLSCGEATASLTTVGNPPPSASTKKTSIVVTGSNDLEVSINVGQWQTTGFVGFYNTEGTYVYFSTSPDNPLTTINSNMPGVYSQNAISHSYTFKPDVFDGVYNMGDTVYMHVYVLLVDVDPGDGVVWVVPDSGGRYARRIGYVEITFSDYISVVPTLMLDTTNPADPVMTWETTFSSPYHGVKLPPWASYATTSLFVKVTTMTEYVQVDTPSGFIDFNDLVTFTDDMKKHDGGLMIFNMKYNLRDASAVGYSSSPAGHSFPVFLGSPFKRDATSWASSLPVTVPSGSRVYLFDLNGAASPFAGEGLIPKDIATNPSDPMRYIQNAYSYTTTHVGGTIDYETVDGSIKAIATFTSGGSFPYTGITVSFSRLQPGNVDLLTYSTLGIQTRSDADNVYVSWRNQPQLSGIASRVQLTNRLNDVTFTGTGFRADSYNVKFTITPVSPSPLAFVTFRLYDASGAIISDYGSATRSIFTNGMTGVDASTDDFNKAYRYEASFSKTSATVYQFNLVAGTTVPGSVTYTSSKTLPVYVDTTVPRPTGSFGLVFFDSPDLGYQSGMVLDSDGAFFLKADVSLVATFTGFFVDMQRVDPAGGGYALLGTLQIGTEASPFTGALLSIDSSSFLPLFDPAIFGTVTSFPPGTYKFTIRPFRSVSGVIYNSLPSIDFGDDAGENAQQSTGGVRIQVFTYKQPEPRFTGGTGILPDVSISSSTGMARMTIQNYFPSTDIYLDPVAPATIQQRVGATLVHTINVNPLVMEPLLFDTSLLANVDEYPTEPLAISPSSLLGRIYSIPVSDYIPESGAQFMSTTGKLWRVNDGTYSFRARFAYIPPYPATISAVDRQLVVTSGRTLTANGFSTPITSYAGQIALQWDQMNIPDTDDYTLESGLSYIILFGKAPLVSASDLAGNDLESINSNVKLLCKKDGFGVFQPHVINRAIGGMTEEVTIDDSGDWGSFDGEYFNDATPTTYHFAVVPIYPVLVRPGQSVYTNRYEWFHGAFSNAVTVTVDKQIITSYSVFPSTVEGFTTAIYTQDNITFQASGVAAGSIQPDSVDLVLVYDEDGDGLVDTLTFPMTPVVTTYSRTLHVFDDLNINKNVKPIRVHFSFTFNISSIIVVSMIDAGEYIVKTGIIPVMTYISPGAGIPLFPGSDSSAELVFSVQTTTEPVALSKGLQEYAVPESAISLSSISFSSHPNINIFANGTPNDDGMVEKIPGTYNWQVTLNDVYDFLENTVITATIGIVIDDGSILISVTGTIFFTVNHGSTTVVISPAVPLNKTVLLTSYNPLAVRWISYFGNGQEPDSVELSITKNGAPYFYGIMTPVTLVYSYTLVPLQHDMKDRFVFTIRSRSGDFATLVYAFAIQLDFKVFVTINQAAMEYNSTNPPVGYTASTVQAWIDITYPASYYYYYLDFGTIINKENWYAERVVGSTVYIKNLEDPIGLITGTVAGLEWGEDLKPTTSQVDRLVFTNLRAPLLAKKGFSFTDNGTVYVENVTMSSSWYFDTITARIVPTYMAFDESDLERWNVTINGVQTTSFIENTDGSLSVFVDEINPGQTISISIIHYYAETPPQPPTPSIWDLIVQFILSIITFILSLFGLALAIARRKRHPFPGFAR